MIQVVRQASYDQSKLLFFAEDLRQVSGLNHAEDSLADVERVPPVMIANVSVVTLYAGHPAAENLKHMILFITL